MSDTKLQSNNSPKVPGSHSGNKDNSGLGTNEPSGLNGPSIPAFTPGRAHEAPVNGPAETGIIRDFSQEMTAQLERYIEEINDENVIADFFNDFGLKKLDPSSIDDYGLEVYHRQMIDKNDITQKKFLVILEEVFTVDKNYDIKLRICVDELEEINTKILNIADLITPGAMTMSTSRFNEFTVNIANKKTGLMHIEDVAASVGGYTEACTRMKNGKMENGVRIIVEGKSQEYYPNDGSGMVHEKDGQLYIDTNLFYETWGFSPEDKDSSQAVLKGQNLPPGYRSSDELAASIGGSAKSCARDGTQGVCIEMGEKSQEYYPNDGSGMVYEKDGQLYINTERFYETWGFSPEDKDSSQAYLQDLDARHNSPPTAETSESTHSEATAEPAQTSTENPQGTQSTAHEGDQPKAEDWPGWYWNETAGWPTPYPPHDTPRASWEEQKAFNAVWEKYGDIGDGTSPPTPEQVRNYLVILSCETGVPLDVLLATADMQSGMTPYQSDGSPTHTGNDWGMMQINENAYSAQYFDGTYGDIKNNWQANARMGAMYARDALDRIPGDCLTEEERQKAYYSCYYSGEHDTCRTNEAVRQKAEKYWENVRKIPSEYEDVFNDPVLAAFNDKYESEKAGLDYLKRIWAQR